MEYRGKHYTIVQGIEPNSWSGASAFAPGHSFRAHGSVAGPSRRVWLRTWPLEAIVQ
jgi:hypothetical protein